MNTMGLWVRGAFVCAWLAAGAGAQQPPQEAAKEDYVKAHYTKYEYRIPMRDGKRLFTSVYVPNRIRF
jgi:predicted acyl esterase